MDFEMDFDTMNIYAPEGTKVRFMNENGYDGERKRANEILDVNKVYTVDYIDVGQSMSYVTLKEYEGQSFNTVMFMEVFTEMLDVHGDAFLDIVIRKDINKSKSVISINGDEIRSQARDIKPRTMVLKGGSPALHKLGDIGRDFDELIHVQQESDDYYVGIFHEGFGFIGVLFNKSDVRPMTKAEVDKLNATDFYINDTNYGRNEYDYEGYPIPPTKEELYQRYIDIGYSEKDAIECTELYGRRGD